MQAPTPTVSPRRQLRGRLLTAVLAAQLLLKALDGSNISATFIAADDCTKCPPAHPTT
ncbi:hypothetical protein ACFWB0_22255 [Rhodococcus sp. NPDC060086]|uniref:hypothetical protein n=1 Tax=Rhodococcus sp. NPDC060086 TaxID=3347055 RepID=UPI00365A3D94